MKRISSLLAFIVILSACKKEPPPSHEPPPCSSTNVKEITNPELKKCRFQAGTYWVFNDSLKPGILDSSGIDGVTVRRGEPGPIFRCMFIEQHESDLRDQRFMEIYGLLTVWPDCCFVYDTRGFRSVFQPRHINRRFKFFDSIQVNGTYYIEVMRSDTIRLQNLAYILPSTCMICYFNPDVGFIRLDVFRHGQLINAKRLLRCKIIR